MALCAIQGLGRAERVQGKTKKLGLLGGERVAEQDSGPEDVGEQDPYGDQKYAQGESCDRHRDQVLSHRSQIAHALAPQPQAANSLMGALCSRFRPWSRHAGAPLGAGMSIGSTGAKCSLACLQRPRTDWGEQ